MLGETSGSDAGITVMSIEAQRNACAQIRPSMRHAWTVVDCNCTSAIGARRTSDATAIATAISTAVIAAN